MVRNEVRLQALHRDPPPPQQPTLLVVKLEGGPAVNVKPGFLLLALSRYIGDPNVIMITGFVARQWMLNLAPRRQSVS
jgi:hypothetical protein